MSNSSALPQLAGPSQVAGRWRPLGALEPGRGAELEQAREQVLGARSWFAEPEHERRTAVDVRSVLADRSASCVVTSTGTASRVSVSAARYRTWT